MSPRFRLRQLLPLCLMLLPHAATAADWSTTEVHFQYGKLDAPSFIGTTSVPTRILTFQHASGWRYGDNFFFVDYLDDSEPDGFNDQAFYAEWYSNFSLGKISGRPIGFGAVKDVGILLGINLSGEAKVRKYLPGVRLSWNLPGFAFLNTDITAYIDDSRGAASGGAPTENNSFMVDINWAYPFAWGKQSFSIEGHIEYIGKRTNEFGNEAKAWILAQPQFRWDAGKTLLGFGDTFFLGIEYQYWRNKLGGDSTESVVQALAVWRF
jgi:nucleoside-specific outer membrane channel protein Tsx